MHNGGCANENNCFGSRLEELLAAEAYFFEKMVSSHPNNDIQIKKIYTITFFHQFFQFLKFVGLDLSTL